MRTLLISLLLTGAFHISAIHAEEPESGSASYDRTTLIVRDMEKSMAFWGEVMNFESFGEPRELPPQENIYLGWNKETTKVTFTGFRSPEGAGVGLIEIEDEGFPSLNIEETPTAYGGMVMVFVAKNIDAIYQRAIKADAVFKPLSLSPTGRSQQMYLKSPSGHVLEIYEVLPKE